MQYVVTVRYCSSPKFCTVHTVHYTIVAHRKNVQTLQYRSSPKYCTVKYNTYYHIFRKSNTMEVSGRSYHDEESPTQILTAKE